MHGETKWAELVSKRPTNMLAHAAGIAVFLLSACTGRREFRTLVPWCVEQEGQLSGAASADGMAGEYALTLVATTGARVEGRLTLLRTDSESLQFIGVNGSPDLSTVVPAYGTAEIALEKVGAVRLGDLSSRDVAKPGVAVLQTTAAGGGAPSIVVRIGSLANDRRIVRFDGGFTALYVAKIDSSGFVGGWRSGVRGTAAEGYFCAFRYK